MASELLNTPRRVRKTYPKHFLNSVHCEIGFIGTSLDSILSTEKSLKLFFESKGFEISRQVFTKEVFMESSLNKAATIISKETPIGLMFSSQKPRIEIQVLDTKVIISNFDYVGFEQFNSQLKEICVGISNFIPRKEVKKVGLRKISSIIIDPVHSYQDACAIFNPALFANVRSGLIKQETLKAHEEVSVIEREDNICVIRAQLKKTSSATSYEACLDFDFVSLASCDIEEVFTSKLPELNDNHFDLFMWAASDDLIKLMEESK